MHDQDTKVHVSLHGLCGAVTDTLICIGIRLKCPGLLGDVPWHLNAASSTWGGGTSDVKVEAERLKA